ncbi:MAG: exodeoxyribonuclease VII small subunit [Candidatus Nanopelagicales bacterium]|nr:exodeoxyribonuclease VII small subunit [Candidatus Nanopelagicales bacterium]MDZ4249318.1 exodeoxyribonuclease VII small subunit [Candidatus Nanopelagicales bacterium]MDZ7576961.1 exodeoxyribonuclease VII small subunit [Candidatus Nanopelagicales bacterium]
MTDESLRELLTADLATLSYEQARDGLERIVDRLEEGSASLEDSLALWERGQQLAKRCADWLDAAQKRLDQAAPAAEQE